MLRAAKRRLSAAAASVSPCSASTATADAVPTQASRPSVDTNGHDVRDPHWRRDLYGGRAGTRVLDHGRVGDLDRHHQIGQSAWRNGVTGC